MRDEQNFYNLLKSIQPNKDFIKFFKLVLADVHKRKYQESSKQIDKIDTEIFNLKRRKEKLLQKNLDGVISDEDYKEQTNICNEQIAIKEIERSEYREKESSADHLIALVETLFENLSTLWLESNFENKQRFQSLVFSEGIPVSNSGFGTTTLALPFNLINGFAADEETLVTPRGFEPLIFRMRT